MMKNMPDDRNIGGKHQNDELMFNHQKALIQTGPVLKIKEPHKHVDHGKTDKRPPLYKREEQYDQVLKTFQHVNNQKSVINKKPPKTGAKNRKPNNFKGDKFQQEEHLRNLKAQQQRIQTVNSKTEKKKDVNNAVTNPTYLFRRTAKKTDASIKSQFYQPPRTTVGMPINSLVRSIKKQEKLFSKDDLNQNSQKVLPYPAIKEVLSNKQIKIQEVQQNNILNRPSNISKESKEIKNEDYILEIPEMETNEQQDYIELKVRLVMLVVKYRIFKKQDLDVMLNRTLLHNPQMDAKQIENIFQEINYDLEQN